MTYHEFRNEVLGMMKLKPKEWRDGQFVFNYINEHYGVARQVQFIERIDCLYDDSQIEAFILSSYRQWKELKFE
jgi:uncharacterized protein YpiB (UPF0302 family)